jgi:tetratricopeptide (TPR) repeat protein
MLHRLLYSLANLEQAENTMSRFSVPANSIGKGVDENQIHSLTSEAGSPGEAQRVIDCLKQRLAHARAQQDRSGESSALLALGVVYNRFAEERRAIGCLELAIAIAHELGERRREGYAQIHLGNTHNRLGNARGALRCYAHGLAIVRVLGDRHDEALVLSYLGEVYVSLSDAQRAWECYTQSRDIFATLGQQHNEALVCWNMGEMLAGQREYARAAALMQLLVDYERGHGIADVEHHTIVLEQVRARVRLTTPS